MESHEFSEGIDFVEFISPEKQSGEGQTETSRLFRLWNSVIHSPVAYEALLLANERRSELLELCNDYRDDTGAPAVALLLFFEEQVFIVRSGKWRNAPLLTEEERRKLNRCKVIKKPDKYGRPVEYKNSVIGAWVAKVDVEDTNSYIPRFTRLYARLVNREFRDAALMRDINHYKLQFQRLSVDQQEELNKQQTLVATTTHDLNSPLLAIEGYAELMQEVLNGDVSGRFMQLQRYTNRIRKGLDDITSMISQLQDWSRLDRGMNKLKMERVDLADIVKEVVDVMKSAKDDLDTRVHFQNDAHTLPVRGDVVRIKRIVYNLVSNALKYTPANQSIDVSVQRTQANAELCVRDEGPGIAADQLDQIFQPYKRLDDDDEHAESSMGLGLYISYQFAQKMGGYLDVQSSKGEGSAFYFRLPLQPSELQAADSSA